MTYMVNNHLTTKHTRKAQGSLEFCAFLLSLNTDHFQTQFVMLSSISLGLLIVAFKLLNI
jgi:hypothetical protein